METAKDLNPAAEAATQHLRRCGHKFPEQIVGQLLEGGFAILDLSAKDNNGTQSS